MTGGCRLSAEAHALPCEKVPVGIFRTECGTTELHGRPVCSAIAEGLAKVRALPPVALQLIHALVGPCQGCGREVTECWSVVPL